MSLQNQVFPILNKGFVTLIDSMGSDLTTVNSARISFGNQKTELDERDEKLIKYLSDHEHTSPFRHAYMTFHVKAPIFVLRQWMKHRIASDFNEMSGRYTEFSEDDFYIPEVYRKQATVNKQGSEGEVEDPWSINQLYIASCEDAIKRYKQFIAAGLCREQARCILPLSMYSEVYWTVSLQAAAHFIHLRTDSHAQWEIQQYAQTIKTIVENQFPISLKSLLEAEKHV